MLCLIKHSVHYHVFRIVKFLLNKSSVINLFHYDLVISLVFQSKIIL